MLFKINRQIEAQFKALKRARKRLNCFVRIGSWKIAYGIGNEKSNVLSHFLCCVLLRASETVANHTISRKLVCFRFDRIFYRF